MNRRKVRKAGRYEEGENKIEDNGRKLNKEREGSQKTKEKEKGRRREGRKIRRKEKKEEREGEIKEGREGRKMRGK